MKKIYFLLFLLATGARLSAFGQQSPGLGAHAAASPPAPLLPGTWTGPLTVVGRTRAIGLVVTRDATGLVAQIAMPGAPLNGQQLRVVQHGDSLLFSDPAANIRFVCEQSDEGRWLIGNWQQLGFTNALALHRLASTPASRPATRPNIARTD